MHPLLSTAAPQPPAPPVESDPYAEGYAAGRLAERAAVVAYLRESAAADEFGAVADAIAKEAALSPTGHGEHRAGGAE